ncbi:MAG TPA: hypothetical protein VNO35_07650 [Steroidobacteraceae bacterium]|nr:hypothetical protein [Steroidobacteraceae bacterium]
MADFPRTHEVLQRRHRFVDRRVDIPVVQPVQVDVVGLQAAQRVLARLDHRLTAGAAPVRIARIEIATEFSRDHQAVALRRVTTDVVSDDLLGVALRVEVCRVDEVAAGGDEAVQDLLRFLDGGVFGEWMTAAGSYGIPTTFIVDRAGKLAWVGHPFSSSDKEFSPEFNTAIEQALNATSDLAASRTAM